MDRRVKVELFEQIRLGHAAGGAIEGIAEKHGIHRSMVRQAISSAIPPDRKKVVWERPKLAAVRDHIDRMLEGNRRAPRKQRLTAHRIWVRLRAEYPKLPVGEPTVRRYVGQRKREFGLTGREAQVDCFEATAKLGGEPSKLQFFTMRSMDLGDAFHRGYTNGTHQAFLEGHEHAFAYFDGYIKRSEPVVLIGECGTGKSYLATGLCLATCRQKRRVRFTTAAALVNKLVEANQTIRYVARWPDGRSTT